MIRFISLRGKFKLNYRIKNITGQKFTRLTVLRYLGKDPVTSRYNWECKCDCGKIKVVHKQHLIKGKTKSCGCYQKDMLVQRGKDKTASFDSINIGRRTILKMYKTSARHRKLKWNLEDSVAFEMFLKNCYYCNSEPSTKIQRKTHYTAYFFNGIDRIDNDKGYYLDNVRTCCKLCNKMKSNLKEEDFYKHIKKIYKKVKCKL